jgi:RNA polymerase subunit RPABC4/transcription elongation factor Spt4
MNCPSCKKIVESEWKTCAFCASDLSPVSACPNCDQVIEEGWVKCPRCGTGLSSDSSPALAMEDVVAKSITQASTVIYGDVTIGQGGVSASAPRQYCAVCKKFLPEDHFKCPECGELACITCRSEELKCKNCAPQPTPAVNASKPAKSESKAGTKPSLTFGEFKDQVKILIQENDWAAFYPDDFEDAYMSRFRSHWEGEIASRTLSGNGNAHSTLLTRLGIMASHTNSFPLSKTGNRRPPRDRPWGPWGWDGIDEYSVD